MDVSPELHGAVGALLQQRTELQGWLARLDELGGTVPDRIAERVRNDYTERLRGVTEALGGHRDAINTEMESLRGELARAEERFATAGDDLEEARLRFQIGELGGDAWEARRPDLESELAEADRVSGEARRAVEHWQQLLTEIDGAPAPAEPAPAAKQSRPAQPQPREKERGKQRAPAAAAVPAARDEDAQFLEELDRAIAASGKAAPDIDGGETTLEEPAAPAATLTCNECGSANDPQAWYCEVCGVEL